MKHSDRSILHEHHRAAILTAVALWVLAPVLASAQIQLQVSEAYSGSEPYTFYLPCHYTITGGWEEWVWAQIDLYVDGNPVGSVFNEGFTEVQGTVHAYPQATTQNQHVICTAYSNVGYGWMDGYLVGIPDGEVTSSGGWGFYLGGELHDTIHRWNQTLTPSNGPYAGRTVSESNPGGGGPDTCHFPESIYLPFNSITVGTWPVESNNGWGSDGVGWKYQAVLYYRNHGRTPCDTNFPQDMYIDVPPNHPPAKYRTNVLAAGITNISVWSQRDGQYVERIWP